MRIEDLLLPVMVLFMVGMMVFPLPIGVLDALLVCNITLSLLLLVGAVYLSEPERFTALPTVLLLATLFRLGLNISTTRQLLGEGEAPDVVLAFGNFVVEGNLVVGAVIFLIVTLVQFLVVAKGAERVAEVAARFTLDAMPGKQMAIDADVRAGILSIAEAKVKRSELQRESRLYGALDGAMKFVKGDAIAGLVITALNIGAGFIVGVAQRGMSAGEAAAKYTIFTIGDGLVSQIPALLTAVAAGIAVTRVSERENSSIGREMWSQLGRDPQALGTTAFVLIVLGCMPGLSFWLFGAMGAALLFGALRSRRKRDGNDRQEREAAFQPKLLPGVALRLSRDAVRLLQADGLLARSVRELREDFFNRYGLLVQDFPFEVDERAAGAGGVILFQGVPTAECPEAGKIFSALGEALRRHRAELLDDTQTRMLMELHQPTCEDLINAVVPKLITVTNLTTLLRRLVREDVSVKNFPAVLQAISEHFAKNEKSGVAALRGLLAEIRIALRRTISAAAARADWELRALVLDSSLDRLIARAAASDSPVRSEIAEALEVEAENAAGVESGEPLVILATRYAREELANLLAHLDCPLRVLAVEELCDEVRLRVTGTFGLPAAEAPESFSSAEAVV